MRRLPGKVADELAARALRGAVARGVLPDRPLPDWQAYRGFRARVRDTFTVPETSITPLMARILYGVAHLARPARVLGVGTYAGNALVWLIGPGFDAHGSYRGQRAVGIDIDPAATALARANLGRLGVDDRVELVCADGHRAGELGHDWDLLLLDADDPDRRKGIYLSLLDATYPALAAGALVLAHDICVDRFREQMARYQTVVADPSSFERTVSLEVDECGLEISIKGSMRERVRR
jgi:predicted O-methyltransferase YrrM